jgi:hypothetical protein
MPVASWLKLDECAGRKNDQQGYHPDGSACPKGHGAKAEQQDAGVGETAGFAGRACSCGRGDDERAPTLIATTHTEVLVTLNRTG